MKRTTFFVVAATLPVGCLPAPETPMIVVDGEGVVSVAPDQFQISGTIFANAPTSEQAIADATKKFEAALSALPSISGGKRVSITSSSASIRPIYDVDCAARASYSQQNSCPQIAHSATIRVTIIGSPAEISGDALSLLSELGATDAELDGFGVADPGKAASQATAAALTDARDKADRLAAASGSSLGRTLRIQYGQGIEQYDRSRPRTFQMTAGAPQAVSQDVTPRVSLTLSPGPIEFRERVTAAFAIEKNLAE